MTKKNPPWLRVLVFAGLGLQLAGCSSGPILPSPIGDVPNNLRIDRGQNPDGQDEFVRFRTTYYFRVMDSCRVQDGREPDSYKQKGWSQVRVKGKLKVMNDSLYRFKMTGKASALFNTVHFESGVLRAEQIDPFGSTVKYDHNAGGYRTEPANVIRKRAQWEEKYQKIGKLLELKNGPLKNESQKARDAIEQLLITQIQQLANGITPPVTIDPRGGTSSPTEDKATSENQNVLCPNGRPFARSYYLYGPEGVRELDPDERLLMAMSSDSKPLTSMLQQLSNRQQSQGTQGSLIQAVGGEHSRLSSSFTEMAETRTLLAMETLDNQRPKVLTKFLTTILEKFESPTTTRILKQRKVQGGSEPGIGTITPTIESALTNRPDLEGGGL